jgi:hypothetical protein
LFTFTAKSIKNAHFVSSERKEYSFVFTLKFLDKKMKEKTGKQSEPTKK